MIVFANFYEKVEKPKEDRKTLITKYDDSICNIIPDGDYFYLEIKYPLNISINSKYLDETYYYNSESLIKLIEDNAQFFTVIEANYKDLIIKFFETHKKGMIKFHF